jgi:isoaspartyl peptidase/L-asparaginase-like protein (Ntn-hydrolase superfamily)
MNDYAYPCMMAEKALKELHNAMLINQHREAVEAGIRALEETVRAIDAIREAIKNDAR